VTFVLVYIFTIACENTHTALVTSCPTRRSYFARMQIRDAGVATLANRPACARDNFFLGRVRFRAKTRRSRLPFDSSYTPRALCLMRGHSHEKHALQAASIFRCSATRVERRAYNEIDKTVQQHGMVRAERNAHRERAACLPRESHNQLCATIAMGRLGSEQAYLPRATEFGRDLPRSTYEGT